MTSSTSSIEQQHQEFKRQISTQDTYPCFLLDQTFQQRVSNPSTNAVPSFLSSNVFSPLTKSPMPILNSNTSRLSTKPSSNQYRLFPTSPSNTTNTNRTTIATTTTTRQTNPIVDVPIEKTIVPLRTMTDLFPSFSYSDMKLSKKKSSSNLSFSSYQPSTTTNSSFGVSIFGFRDEDCNVLVQQFEDLGQIDKLERPLGSENGNFINIIYTNHVACQNALNRDGTIFNGLMLGVVPLNQK